MNGADLLIACLEHAGVDHIYGVPGEETADLMIAIKHSDITFVLTRHEQAAAFMASVHGRLTGQSAACLATLGPGATNLATGVADATLDYAPMLVITGQASQSRTGLSESHQVIDLVRFFEPITKRSVDVRQGQDIPHVVAEALRLATSPRPGAVHLCLPEDVAGSEVEGEPIAPPSVALPHVASASLGQAIAKLKGAHQPLLIAGADVIRHGVAGAVAALCESTNMPLITSFMAKGILPEGHTLHVGTSGQPIERPEDEWIASSDCIIAVGLDPVEFAPSRISDGSEAPMIVIDSVAPAADVGWGRAVGLIGDPAHTLTALTLDLQDIRFSPWKPKGLSNSSEPAHATNTETQSAFAPGELLNAVDEALPRDALVLSGVGTHKLEIAEGLPSKGPGQLIIANGLAGMGLALPGAIAAAQLHPDRPVLTICGDGDLLMNVQDMETASRLGVAPVVMVWEDGGYGLIERKEQGERGEHNDLSFGPTDWAALAKAFGWRHSAPTTLRSVHSSLQRAIAQRKPTLITVPIDYARGAIAPHLAD